MQDFTNIYQEKDSKVLDNDKNMPRLLQAGLIYFKKYSNVRRQGFGQRMAVCEHLKTKGNELFKQNDIEAAIREYEQAVSIFRYIVEKGITLKSEVPEYLEYIDFAGEDLKEKGLIRNIKVALYNNLAACYLKANDFKNAKFACDEALLLDPNQTKALYRRAKAIMSISNSSLEDYNIGLEDLKKANILSPHDATILQTLNQIKQEISRIKAGSDTFKGFFSEKVKGTGQSTKKDSEDFNDNSMVSTQAKSEDSIDQIIETPSNKKKSIRDSQTLDECYQSLSKSNLDSPITFNQEVGKLGKILNEISETSNKAKGNALTNGLKEHLDKAMTALHRLEELASLDLRNPTKSMKNTAKKFGLNMNGGASLQEELKGIQAKSLEEIKLFIDEFNLNDKIVSQNGSTTDLNETITQEPAKGKSSDPEKPITGKTTNNYFINNNYFTETDSLYEEFSRLTERIQAVDNLKNQKKKPGVPNIPDQKLLNDLAKDFSKLNHTGKRGKAVKIMNLVIVVVAVTLLLATVVLQSRNTTVDPKEIRDI